MRKNACEMLRQITFFRVSLALKRRSVIFNVSNAWANMWNKMMEEKAGAERQNSKKGFEKNEQACSVEGVFVVSDPSARPYLKVAGQTRKIQSSSKL